MKNNHYLEQQFEEILSRVKRSTSTYGEFDTCTVLCELASTSQWGKAEVDRIDFLSKRFDISKRLFAAYLANGRKAIDIEITDITILELLTAVLLKAVLVHQDAYPVEVCLKRFNTLFKVLDITKPKWLLVESGPGKALEFAWQSLLQALNSDARDLKITPLPNLPIHDGHASKVIPLTVLFYEGPIARAYIATLKGLGFRPEKIIELVAAKDVATKKTVGKWLPGGLRAAYATSIQRSKIHYWPKQLSKENPGFVSSILDEVQKKFGFSRALIDDANALSPLTDYSDCVESLLIEGLTDTALLQYLSEESSGAILFTGGGIVPTAILDLQHLKFLHIHPGHLPDIRGADCALWSTLMTGHTSASCFYMSSGIDTGNIISSCWLPELSFDVDISTYELQSIYRAAYAFLDPWIRSFVLREIINEHLKLDELDSIIQSEEDGTTFHFMHKKLRQAAFKRLFTY